MAHGNRAARGLLPADTRLVLAVALALSTMPAPVALRAADADPTAAARDLAVPPDTARPVRIELFPKSFRLDGPRATVRLVATAFDAQGIPFDVTSSAEFHVADAQLLALDGHRARPLRDGRTTVAARLGDLTAVAEIEVAGHAEPAPVSFRHEVLPVLSKQNCSSGACHGSPSGKGSFRLSLRAANADLDRLTLIREEFGRRTNPADPDTSLILAKPLMRAAHGGGQQLRLRSPEHLLLREWIAAGVPVDSPEAPRCTGIELHPGAARILAPPRKEQTLSVTARFSDGSVRDVTDLAVLTVSDADVLEMLPEGRAVGRRRGTAAVLARYLEHLASLEATVVEPAADFAWDAPPARNFVDELVDRKLRLLQYLPSAPADDSEFLRRVSLDLTGLLPEVDRTRAFLGDANPNKRDALIDELLESPEHARFWTSKWGDLLRLSEKQLGPGGVVKFHAWLEHAWRSNVPYDRFVRELLVASGSSYENPAANFHRTTDDPDTALESFAQVFLGSRMQCAKCHNHPFERWTRENHAGLSVFFRAVQRKSGGAKDEVVLWSRGEKSNRRPWVPGTGELDLPADSDPRRALADWLCAPQNPWFARIEANRIWAHLFGTGLVEPFDDFRDSNPPSNGPLLDALAQDFAASGFDRRRLLRNVLRSRTWQAASRPRPGSGEDRRYGSHSVSRRLTAEQLLDAVSAATGSWSAISKTSPETRATQLPTSDLGVVFDRGKPAYVPTVKFLKTFGQPERSTSCGCERLDGASLEQALALSNGEILHAKLTDPRNRIGRGIARGAADREIVAELFVAALCREPTAADLERSLAHLATVPDRRTGLEDVAWALLNSEEFVFRR